MEQLEPSVMSHARDLIPRACQLISNYQEIRQKSGADFNIFKTLKRNADEEFGHSAFLAELLNLRGSHGQGGLFLTYFSLHLGWRRNFGTSLIGESLPRWVKIWTAESTSFL